VQCLESGALEEIAGIKGLYYWKDGEIVYTGPPELIDDLDSIPFPARHLLDFGPYLVPPGMIRGYAMERVTTLLTSRGCPYPCTYCASHIVQGKKVRRRTAANVIAELETLVRDYRIRGFYICDDLVTGDREWMMEFSRQLAQKNLGLRWACQSRVDYVDEEMLSVMKQAGCVQIDFGVESGSDKTLKTMKKKATADEARAAFALMHRMKMRACATFILGFPGETEEDMEETYRLAKEINADYTAFYFLTPYPGTPIYNMAVQNAWIDPKLVADERFTHRQAAVPIMAIEHSPEKLAAIRRRFQNRFFVHNYLRWRNLRFYGSLLWALLGATPSAPSAVFSGPCASTISWRRCSSCTSGAHASAWGAECRSHPSCKARFWPPISWPLACSVSTDCTVITLYFCATNTGIARPRPRRSTTGRRSLFSCPFITSATSPRGCSRRSGG